MLILSIHCGGHDATAVLHNEYDLIAAVQLERLTRKKSDGNRYPIEAVDEVLNIGGYRTADVDKILFSRMGFPARYFTHWPALKRTEYAIKRWLGTERRKDLASEMLRIQEPDARKLFDAARFQAENQFRRDAEIGFYNHHFAHALSALFYTDWQDALLYTADGGGDNVHYSAHLLQSGRLQTLHGGEEALLQKRRVDSLGLAYGFATQALGYRMNRHEGKLTGLAAWGEPSIAAEIGRHFFVDNQGCINSDFIDDTAMRTEIHRLAAATKPANVAASIQQVLEDRILEAISQLLHRNRVTHLGLAGGVFANVRLNRLIADSTGVDEVFIFPGMGDEGIAAGGVHQYLLHRDGLETWLSHRHRLQDVYLGRCYDADIDRTLEGSSAVRRLDTPPAETAAGLLAEGYVGAIYHGRMEFGPRALGARSILASPADSLINTKLNERLNRSEFMPFAPYVLAEDCDEVFELPAAARYAARFMTITCNVRTEWRDRIPAVVHIDGTARPQVIDPGLNPLYAAVLQDFKRRSGLPVLVNTSFNAHEEPIINRPEECLNALLNNRIDFVVTGQAVYQLKNAVSV